MSDVYLSAEEFDNRLASVRADERARCIAVLEALRTRQMNNDFTYWYLVALDDAIDALKANEETT